MTRDLEVLSSFDRIITTSTSDNERVSEAEEQMSNPKRRTTYDSGLCLAMNESDSESNVRV